MTNYYFMDTAEAAENFKEDSSLSLGDWQELQTRHADVVAGWEEIPYCNPGDYNNSCSVERANFKWIETWISKQTADTVNIVKTLSGWYSTESVIWNSNDPREACPDCEKTGRHFATCEEHLAWEEIKDVVEGLAGCPAIDDDALSELESEESAEAYESWARDDFKKAMIKLWAEDQEEFWIPFSKAQQSQIDQMFEEMREAANEYWESNGSSMWIDVEDIAKHPKERPTVPYADDVAFETCRALSRAGFVTRFDPIATANSQITEPERLEPFYAHSKSGLDAIISSFDLPKFPKELHPKNFALVGSMEKLWSAYRRMPPCMATGSPTYRGIPVTPREYYYNDPFRRKVAALPDMGPRPYVTSLQRRQYLETTEALYFVGVDHIEHINAERARAEKIAIGKDA